MLVLRVKWIIHTMSSVPFAKPSAVSADFEFIRTLA